MSNYILQGSHIGKKYGKHNILNDVTLNLKQGEIYGLIGKNGSGKTTLFRILTGLIQDHSGTVSINEHSKISAIINTPSLFLNMTAFQNVKSQSYLLGIKDNNKIRQILKTVGLPEKSKKLVKDFSHGMTQRLKLALTLLENPDILILDEPSNGLDPDGIVELRELMIDLNRSQGITILVSSHILSELGLVATRLGILHEGKIVRELSDKGVFQNSIRLEKIYRECTRKGGGNHD